MRVRFEVGDRVIYAAPKRGPRPSSAARNLHPSASGEDYSYIVTKFWVVDRIDEDGIVIRTRKGKLRHVAADDPKLRKASWLERIFYRNRFPADFELRGDAAVSRGT